MLFLSGESQGLFKLKKVMSAASVLNELKVFSKGWDGSFKVAQNSFQQLYLDRSL